MIQFQIGYNLITINLSLLLLCLIGLAIILAVLKILFHNFMVRHDTKIMYEEWRRQEILRERRKHG